MTIAGTRKKGTGGLVTAPPEPLHKALRRMEKAYGDKCAELDRANSIIRTLQEKIKRMKRP